MSRPPRFRWILVVAVLVLGGWLVASTAEPGLDPELRAVFREQVLPILEARCRPCHFPGGDQYGQLPFDEPDTILRLGEPALKRLRKEPEEAAVLRGFLERAGALEP